MSIMLNLFAIDCPIILLNRPMPDLWHDISDDPNVYTDPSLCPTSHPDHLETLAVHDGGSGLFVLLLADPHLLEGGQGGQDGATDPHGVLTLWRSDDLNLHGCWSEGSDLLLHPVSDARIHRGAAGEDSVGVQILTDVHVTLHDGVIIRFMDTSGFHPQEGRLE